jgi:hypothetical protein
MSLNKSVSLSIRVATTGALILWGSLALAAGGGPDWLYGYWYTTADEDHTPADCSEFRPDGIYVTVLPDCTRHTAKYHFFEGDIYVTVEIPGKGPVALVLRPNEAKTTLTFTSFRTHNNSVLEKSKPHLAASNNRLERTR